MDWNILGDLMEYLIHLMEYLKQKASESFQIIKREKKTIQFAFTIFSFFATIFTNISLFIFEMNVSVECVLK